MGNPISSTNIGLLLNFHQSVRLNQISKTNDAILRAQWQQNQTLAKLSNQLDQANSTSKTILENQINQIKKEEEQRLCKSLLFTAYEIVDLISKAKNDLVRAHFIFNLKDKIRLNLEFCKNILTEFSDLKQVKDTLYYFDELGLKANWVAYNSSLFNELNQSIEKSLAEKENLIQEEKILKRRIRTFQVPSKGFLGLNSAANKTGLKALEDMQSKLQNISEAISSYETDGDLKLLFEKVENDFPELEEIQRKIIQIEGDLFQKLQIDLSSIFSNPIIKVPSDLRPLIEKACKTVIFNRGGSIQILQRKFGLPYRRAERLLDVLTHLNVLGPFNGIKSREVLITEGEIEDIMIAIEG